MLMRLSRKLLRLGVSMALLAAPACSSVTNAESGAALRATVVSDGVRLENPGSAPVFYVLVPTSLLPVFDWVPCTEGPYCEAVPAGGWVVAPWPGGFLAGNGPEHTLYWWRAKPDGNGGTQPDSIRTVNLVR